MAGYGLKSFLIAQSLNQIEKAYGQSNAILDNCHVRVSFATNDERTAKRISDALGTATEQRAMKNYAGHRLSPWLGHLMVSRTETARALLTPGEVMQLPSDEEIVMASGLPPIRAKKARYFADARFKRRILSAPAPYMAVTGTTDDWNRNFGAAHSVEDGAHVIEEATGDSANGGIRQEPELPLHEDVAPPPAPVPGEFDFGDQDEQADAARLRAAADRRLARGARAASLDPDDGIDL
jgi:type IV secretion system protein VirD4